MVWFSNFFNKDKLKGTQPCPTELKNQNFTGVVQSIIEEAILASAYWLIGLVNSSLENRAAAQVQVEERPTKPNALEEIVPKVVSLLERFNEHSQSVSRLADRIDQAEAALQKSAASEQSRQVLLDSIAALESRLAAIETSVNAVAAAQETSPPDQPTAALEARIAHIEKLLSRYSVVPKLIEQNRQTIAVLQQRLIAPEFPHQNGDRQRSAANVN